MDSTSKRLTADLAGAASTWCSSVSGGNTGSTGCVISMSEKALYAAQRHLTGPGASAGDADEAPAAEQSRTVSPGSPRVETGCEGTPRAV